MLPGSGSGAGAASALGLGMAVASVRRGRIMRALKRILEVICDVNVLFKRENL
jgi:hypothetical protein